MYFKKIRPSAVDRILLFTFVYVRSENKVGIIIYSINLHQIVIILRLNLNFYNIDRTDNIYNIYGRLVPVSHICI